MWQRSPLTQATQTCPPEVEKVAWFKRTRTQLIYDRDANLVPPIGISLCNIAHHLAPKTIPNVGGSNVPTGNGHKIHYTLSATNAQRTSLADS